VRGHSHRSVVERSRRAPAPNIAEESPAPDEAMKALNRIADTIERVAVQLDSYQQERVEHYESIEFLLREMVLGTALPSSARSEVLGGVIDATAIDHLRAEINLSDRGYPLEIETEVEVRSRFHDRWICGFTISEVVEGHDRFRYRLTRRSDGIPLPILFDAWDVRATLSRADWQRSPD
jgi:hypothetical protein